MDSLVYAQQEGIVLKKMAYSEADEVATILLKNEGIQKFFVPGGRKSRKRFAGLIDHFAHITVTYQRRARGLWRLLEVSARGSRKPVTDLSHYAFAHFFSELICLFTPESVYVGEIYVLWLKLQACFAQGEFSHKQAALFVLSFFKASGYDVWHEKSFAQYPKTLFTGELSGQSELWSNCLVRLVEFARTLAQKPLPAAEFYLLTSR